MRCRVRVFEAGMYTSLLRRAARTAVKGERLPSPCLVDVTMISGAEMRRLNHSRRGVDKVTDVLSFPMGKDTPPDIDTGRVFLGDVLISMGIAEKQAGEYGHSLERELAFLTVHGVLHLLGYDHIAETERAAMREREEYIMERIGLFR